MKIRKGSLLILGLLLVASASLWGGANQEAPAAEEKVYTIRLAHNHSEKGLYYIGSVKFMELVEARAGGRVKFEHYPAGQLGADRDIQEGIQLATIEAGVSSSPVVLLNDYFKLLDAPYLFVNRQHVTKVMDGEIGRQLAKPLEELGIKHLGYFENGFRQITNNIRPIDKPADLAGIKLRTPESPVRVATFKAYGANPLPMSFKEVFGALQQGVIDGQENPLSTIYQASLQEVQKYLSMTGHVYSAAHLLMNKELFDSLPADLQGILIDAGREAAAYTRKIGEENDGKLIDELKKAGVQVNQADVKAFVAASQAVWKMITEENKHKDAADLLKRIAALAK